MNINDDKYEYITKSRPHVVILGAGASCAAIPKGDRNGMKISAMRGFIDKLGLSDVLKSVSLKTQSDNLEDIYMELDERSRNELTCQTVKEKLENCIRDYMSSYKIPCRLTVYDFLIMSLTAKDLIVTFNWDSLLVQAVGRIKFNFNTNIPKIVFLHGNVAVGYCENDNVVGNVGLRCIKCGKLLEPMKLLYPIKHKDYSKDAGIANSWDCFRQYLNKAYMITIFGYSAPKSDVEALDMMKRAWGKVDDRKLEEIEIIDIKDENEAKESWSDFINTDHYSYHTHFFSSSLAMYPRRTCEATFDRLMNCKWLLSDKGFKENMTCEDIYNITHELIEEENSMKGQEKILSDPYICKNVFCKKV